MTRWQKLELWLLDHDSDRFSAEQLAVSMGVDTRYASNLIQHYLQAQRGPDSATVYVLKRQGRTRSAVWSIGQRTADAHVIGSVLFDDVHVKVLRAFAPDLERLGAINPRARRYCEAKIAAVLDGAMKVLAASVDGIE